MVTAHEILAYLRTLEIDGDALAAFLARKVSANAYEKLTGAGKAAVSQLVKRFKDWRGENSLLTELESTPNQSDRERLVRQYLESWIQNHTTDALEAQQQLYRIVYLKALRAYCSEIAMISSLGTKRLSIEKVWVPQTFHVQTTAASSLRKGDVRTFHYDGLGEAIQVAGSPTILEAGAGFGKSTQLRKLTLDSISKLLALEDFERFLNSPIPVYVAAGDLLKNDGNLAASLHAATSASLGLYLPFAMPIEFFNKRCAGSAKSLLLLVDGVDEIEREKRDYLIDALRHAASDTSDTIVLASRSLERHDDVSPEGFSKIQIAELSEGQAQALVTKLLSGKDSDTTLGHQHRLPRNPMLLTVATILQREQSSSKAALYREFVYALLHKRIGAGTLPNNPGALFQMLSSFANSTEMVISRDSNLKDISAELLSDRAGGLSPELLLERLLVATGLIIKRNDQLGFIHHSFKEYFVAEELARRYMPNAGVWDQISPFRESWEIISFVVEIWLRDRKNVAAALSALLSFGDDGMRCISMLAFRSKELPIETVKSTIAKWTYREDDFWQAGYVDGPIQQLTLIAFHYDEARTALRNIAKDNVTFLEDSAYAAVGLARIGLREEAKNLLLEQCSDPDVYSNDRLLAAESIFEIGFISESKEALKALYSEWMHEPPDMELSLIRLGEALHKVGQKKTALSLLKRLSKELSDDLDLRFLAEAYANLGYTRPAAKLARRVFEVKRWSAEASRGFFYDAIELADLLERVGARRQAKFIRDSIARPENAASEQLQSAAVDGHLEPQRRLDAAKELVRRGDSQFGLSALAAIASDFRIPHHIRSDSLICMSGEKEGHAWAVKLLTTIIENEPWHGVWCGAMLVQAGEVEAGWSTLRRVALDPAEAVSDRVDAIEELAKLGRIDIAASAFRRLSRSKAITTNVLSTLAKTFAHTAAWPSFLSCCEQILTSDYASLRLGAYEILKETSWLSAGRNRAENILRAIMRDRDVPVRDRIRAAEALGELYGWDESCEFLSDIMADPDEGYEAGIVAMGDLYRKGDQFGAIDGGHEVVWDSKLSPDQFVEAAHEFIELFDNPSGEADHDAEMLESVTGALVKIVEDRSQPIERRMAAAGNPAKGGSNG